MMRHHKWGNIRSKAIYTIFKEKMDKIDIFWRLNLDEIERCAKCEFRYACTDCRSIEESLTGKLDGKSLCGYNPTNGAWI